MHTDDWLYRSTSSRPHDVFIETPARSWSFLEVDTKCARHAASLAKAGIRRGDVIGVWADNRIETVISLLALPRVGATVQLLNTRLTPSELRTQLAATGAVGVVGTDQPLGVPNLDPDDGDSELRDSLSSTEIAVIAYTSGTTGEPRGVMLTQANLDAAVRASVRHLDHQATDTWLAVLPLFHIGGASIVFRSAFVGSKVVLHERFDSAQAAAALHEVTMASLVGAMLEPILKADPGPYHGTKAVLVGGGATPPDLMDRAYEAGLSVLATYGMTEAASQVATAPLRSRPAQRVAALPGVKLLIDAGQIFVQGDMVARWFVGQDAPGPDWLPTGDLGVVDEHGMLTVLGRSKDMIISGGENIAPQQVEHALLELDAVKDCGVVGIPDDTWGELVAAAVVTERDIASLEEALRENLAGFKIPKRWIAVDKIPRNQMGKVDRDATQRLFGVEHG